jgi:Tfp pilus assembly protein PilN
MKIINLLPKQARRELQLELISKQIFRFWIWVVFSVAVFFVLIWISVFYMESEMQRVEDEITVHKKELSSSNTLDLQNKVKALNQGIKNFQNLQSQHYLWSKALVGLSEVIPADSRIETLSMDRQTGKVEISGFSTTRESVIQFWANVKKSRFFKDIDFPLSNLEKATDVPFTYTFYINPEQLK